MERKSSFSFKHLLHKHICVIRKCNVLTIYKMIQLPSSFPALHSVKKKSLHFGLPTSFTINLFLPTYCFQGATIHFVVLTAEIL